MASRIYWRRTQGKLPEHISEAYTGCQCGQILSEGYDVRLMERR